MSGCRLSWTSKYSIPGRIGIDRRSFLLAIVLATGAALLAALPAGAASTTIFFEGEGPEAGVTDPGACCFSFQGADFTGFEGVVAPENPALVASGEFAYRVAGTDIGLVITFEPSVDSVSFFFVHEVDEPGYGFAAASDGNQLATFESRVATTPADPANFVFAGPSEPIASIWLFGLPAYIDDFTFTPSPVPEPGRVLACGTALVAIFALRLLRMEAEKWWKTEADAPVVRVQEGWDRSFRDRVRSINGRMSVNGRTRQRLTHNVSCEGLRENNFSEPPAHEPKALEVFAT